MDAGVILAAFGGHAATAGASAEVPSWAWGSGEWRIPKHQRPRILAGARKLLDTGLATRLDLGSIELNEAGFRQYGGLADTVRHLADVRLQAARDFVAVGRAEEVLRRDAVHLAAIRMVREFQPWSPTRLRRHFVWTASPAGHRITFAHTTQARKEESEALNVISLTKRVVKLLTEFGMLESSRLESPSGAGSIGPLHMHRAWLLWIAHKERRIIAERLENSRPFGGSSIPGLTATLEATCNTVKLNKGDVE